MKRINLLVIAVLVLSLLVVAVAAPASGKQRHQHIASVVIKQHYRDVRILISVMDLGPSRKYAAKVFKRGAIIRDDMGRQIAIRGDAKLLYQGRTFQQFRLAGVELLNHREMKRAKIIRVAHLTIG